MWLKYQRVKSFNLVPDSRGPAQIKKSQTLTQRVSRGRSPGLLWLTLQVSLTFSSVWPWQATPPASCWLRPLRPPTFFFRVPSKQVFRQEALNRGLNVQFSANISSNINIEMGSLIKNDSKKSDCEAPSSQPEVTAAALRVRLRQLSQTF